MLIFLNVVEEFPVVFVVDVVVVVDDDDDVVVVVILVCCSSSLGVSLYHFGDQRAKMMNKIQTKTKTTNQEKKT